MQTHSEHTISGARQEITRSCGLSAGSQRGWAERQGGRPRERQESVTFLPNVSSVSND